MGNNTSSAFSATNIVNDVINTTIMSVSANCSSNASNAQEISVSDLTLIGCELNISGLSQQQTIKNNFSCLQQTKFSNTIKNTLATNLDQQISAALSGLNIGLNNQSDVETITNIKNNIVNSVDMSSISNCIATSINSQKVSVGKITADCTKMKNPQVNISDINQVIVSESVAKCTQSSSALNNAIAQLDNFVKTKAEASNEGLSTTALVIGLIVFGVVCLVILAIVMGFNPITIAKNLIMSAVSLFSGSPANEASAGVTQPQVTQPSNEAQPSAEAQQ